VSRRWLHNSALRLLSLVAALSALSATWANAEEAPNVSTTIVDTTSGAFNDDPVRAEVVSEDELARSGATRLDEALGELAGVVLQQTSGLGVSAIVDGLPSSQVTVLVDGLPAGRATNTRSGPVFDLASFAIDRSRVRRIEVYRGVGPAGTGETGGVVINIVTHTRVEFLTMSVSARGGMVAAVSEPSSTQIHRGNFDLGFVVPIDRRWSTELRGALGLVDGLDVDADASPDLPNQQLISALARVRYQRDSNRHVDLAFDARNTQTTRRALTESARATELANTPERLNGLSDDQTRLRLIDGAARVRWRLGPNLQLRNELIVQQQQYTFDKIRTRDRVIEPNHTTSDLSLRQAFWLSIRRGSHRIEPEISARVNSTERTNRDERTSGFSRKYGSAGIGVSDSWEALDALTIDARVFGEFHTLFGPGGVAGGGAAIRANNNLTFRASGSHTRRVPVPEELFFRFDHSEVGYVIEGNPDLRPESLSAVRTGAVLSYEMWAIETEGYWQNLHDAITVDTVVASENSAATFRYTNRDRVRSAGLNSSFLLRDLPGGLSFRVRHAWLPYSEVDVDGGRLPLSTQHDVRVRLSGKWLSDRLAVWTGLDARTALEVPTGSPPASASATLSAGVSWAFDFGLTAQLDAENLTNHVNADWGPSPGRAIFLGLSYHFEGSR
jgi:outer membrane receptor for ferrienterochelin and colicins